LIKRSDVVSRGAVAALPAFGVNWLDTGDRPIELIVVLAVIAVVALLVAAVAYGNDPRHRPRRSAEDDSEIFTTTPLPMSNEDVARMRADARHAYSPFRLPRWVQFGSLVVACGITFVAAQRLRRHEAEKAADNESSDADMRNAIDRGDPDDASPESLDLSPASAPPFSFRVRDWVAVNGGCTGRFEVTKGAEASWTLTARVHDDRGQLIDSARARVLALRAGDVVEFQFPRTSCERIRIGAWDVSGNRNTP
jgi:hypothetical protein